MIIRHPDLSQGQQRIEDIMGMPIGIDVRDAGVDPSALDAAFDWLRWVDATFSTYRPDSEISRFNRKELSLSELHPDVRHVLYRCEELCDLTAGYFDVRSTRLPPEARSWDSDRFPDAVDPAGYVKGWSVDRAASILEEAVARNYCINAGGDVRVRGGALPAEAWEVGIQHPYIQDKLAEALTLTDTAIATSGTYVRGEHIVDPVGGRTPVGVLSVTIIGPDLGTADAYATAAFAMGEDGPAWTASLVDYEAMTILAGDRVLKTQGFP